MGGDVASGVDSGKQGRGKRFGLAVRIGMPPHGDEYGCSLHGSEKRKPNGGPGTNA